jgi:predicted metal-binding protein
MTDRVIICESCMSPDGVAYGTWVAEQLRTYGPPGVQIETAPCLNQCNKPVALALRSPGKDAYLFSGFDPAIDITDALALVNLYINSPGGVITDARPAGRLRHCLVGRIPG